MNANVYCDQLGNALMEAGITQIAFSEQAHVSRESISAYKRGIRVAPPDVKSRSVLLTDNAFLAVAAAHESTAGTSAVILDGDDIELNRHTVIATTAREAEQLLAIIGKIQPLLGKPPHRFTTAEREQMEYLIQEALDVITMATNLAAVICREAKLSWVLQWSKHKTKLSDQGLLKKRVG